MHYQSMDKRRNTIHAQDDQYFEVKVPLPPEATPFKLSNPESLMSIYRRKANQNYKLKESAKKYAEKY